MKLTWDVYQQHQNRDDYDSLDIATVDALLDVVPPAMKNPTARSLYDYSQQRLLRRRDKIREEEKKTSEEKPRNDTSDKWYKKPVGIVILTVTAATIAFLVRAILIHSFPNVL